MKLKIAVSLCTWIWFLGFIPGASAEDWPQWRHDARHSAETPEPLPDPLYLQWTREYSPRIPAWEDPLNQDLMNYDRDFEPVVLGDRLFIGFNDRDKLVALDIQTGEVAWTFFSDGPVRLPPAAWQGKVYFVSDDGYLYCVDAERGTLIWKFRGGPSARKVLGNGRAISAWPARGGPVIRDGLVYFAASIWPFMGTFIYALDARTSAVRWVNDSTGAQYLKQPHSAPAFAGVAPQGALAATEDFLLVPGGRSVPAAFDRKTGKFLYFQLDEGGKGNGGSLVLATESEFFAHTRQRGTRAFNLKTGKKSNFTINEPVLAADAIYASQDCSLLATAVVEAEQKVLAARQSEVDARQVIDQASEDGNTADFRRGTNALARAAKAIVAAQQALSGARKALGTNWAGTVIQAVNSDKKVRWELPTSGSGDLIKAGGRLYGAGTNSIYAVELPAGDRPARVIWSCPVDGHISRLLAANGQLFAVTREGRILAFGGRPQTPRLFTESRLADRPLPREALERAAAILEKAEARDGYALWFGADDRELLEAVVRQSRLQVVVADANAAKVEPLRHYFDACGLYGQRVVVHAADPLQFKAPPYIAQLVVVGASFGPKLAEPAMSQALYESVRPYGGVLWVDVAPGEAPLLAGRIEAAKLANAKISCEPGAVAVVRAGALPGAADWTHQYGDVANSVKSDDQRVRLPLGLLWFGGNNNREVLPRHGHGPSEQVVGGRLFIEGMNCLNARDVYTGRTLWKTELEDLDNFGVYYDATYTNLPLSTIYNQKHIPGANARGANFVATADSVYVVASNFCRVLDARNGALIRTLSLSPKSGETEPPQWGYLGVYEDILLAGAGFARYSRQMATGATNRPATTAVNLVDLSASRGLIALDRRTGQVLWQVEARHSFLHNGIVAGNGRVYCLDKLPKSVVDKWKRRGRAAPPDYRLAAFDARNGQLRWETTNNVFGTWLSYSPARDVLLQAGASASDRLKDEADKGLVAYGGRDGSVRWQKLDLKYTGPCILHNDTLLTTPGSYKTNAGAFNLLDGAPRQVTNPLTGLAEPMRIYRTYGCSYPVACEHLVTFRSGAAGFYDLDSHSGTGNFGGFKSGCSPNLIAADGVLNAPDYTRTCTCPYQNQTSLALVHMPELAESLEIWTHNQFGADAKAGVRIQRVGINFGAPGDRLAETGTLWLDSPNVSGSSPNLFVTVIGNQTYYFRRHPAQVTGAGPAWVMASGVSGAETILINPATRPPPPATVVAPRSTEDTDDQESAAEKKPGEPAETASSTPAVETKPPNPKSASQAGPLSLDQAPYTVRLYFAEPDDLPPGERLLNVRLQGQTVLNHFDIAAEAGGRLHGIVKEFRGVLVSDLLTISLSTPPGQKPASVICGVEMILEKSAN